MNSLTMMTKSMKQILEALKDMNPSTCWGQQQQKLGLITTATMISGYALYKLLSKSVNDDGCPTVPYSSSLKGSSAEYSKNPRAFVEKWTKKLGPVYRVHLFGRIHTVVSDRYVREVFLNNNFDFFVGAQKKFDMNLLAGIPDGEVTAEIMRKTIVQHLTPHMKQFTPRVVENLCLGLDDVLGAVKQPKEVSEIFVVVQRMVARASASVFVGEELSKNEELVGVFQNMTSDIATWHPRYYSTWLTGFPSMMRLFMRTIGKYSPVVRHYRKVVLQAITPEIDRRLNSAKNDPSWRRPDDILQELVENAAPPAGQNIYIYILNQLLFLTFASILTTSENGTTVLYRILQNPELIDELLEEQQTVIKEAGLDPAGSSSQVFSSEVIKKMTKLDSVCRETLRLRHQYLELPHTNITKSNIVLSNGTVIPPDGDVLINMWHNHNNGKHGDAANNNDDDLSAFKPFRFVDSGHPSTKVGDNYLVFGEGKHACPGRWFAIQEIKTIVSLLIRDYKIRASGGLVFPIQGPGVPYGKVIVEKRNVLNP